MTLTRRCAQREFLLRPDEETNQIYLYCLAVAAAKFDMQIIVAVAMSDHHHITLYDRLGKRVEFYAYLHMLLARAMNVLRGRGENFWSNEPPCVVELVDRAAVVEKVVYVATNPVNAGLVERADQWPGVNTVAALLGNRTITVQRPPLFFRADGEMPKEITLHMTVPAELGDAEQFRTEVAERVAAVEAAAQAARAETGMEVRGRRGVLVQSWQTRPTTPAARGGLRPRFATRSREALLAAIARYRAFLGAYRDARKSWLAKLPAMFPAGTYWLRRFAAVPVANADAYAAA